MAANETETKKTEAAKTEPTAPTIAQTVATPAENAKLEHSAGGATTRDDLNDAGVTMLPGDKSEPVGPEDAFGEGAKRGDYTGRVVAGESYVSVPIPDAAPGEATSRLVPQSQRAQEIGEVAGKKGGVQTA